MEKDIRCGTCSRKLAVGEYVSISIKCPRCGTINSLRAESPKPERPGASLKELRNDLEPERS